MKILIALFLAFSARATTPEPIFRLHLTNEPTSLDPNLQRSFTSSYLLGNLYRNLLRINEQNELVPDLGVECKRDRKRDLQCLLNKNLQWSDGSPLTAQDFLNTYKKILNAKTKAPRADILFKIKNAQDIYLEKKPASSLGITAPNAWTLKFEFQTPDPEFEFNLASTILAPTKSDLSAFNGPYKLNEWKKGQKITIERNSYYSEGHPQRPKVEFLFIEEDAVALQLYQKGELQFLRRLPTLFIPKYKAQKDFQWVPVIRLDYIGFGPELKNNEDIRKAFIYSLNYRELQKIFFSEGLPGCIGLPDAWFPQKAPCYEFNLKKVPSVKSHREYLFAFSSQGGEDHKRATEWMQNQWNKNTGLRVRLESKENKIFLDLLDKNPPALFRKGVSPAHPTCLSALETFSAENQENYLKLQSEEYQEILDKLSQASSESERKKLCLMGTQYLLDHFLFIPTGAIHFAMLIKPEWVGWKLNQSNQLDLSNLHLKP